MRKPGISGSAFSIISLALGLCLFASIQGCKNPFAHLIGEKKESAASPEIVLEVAGGSAIASGGSFDFGKAAVSVATDQVFVLRNSGKSALKVSTGISGNSASSFSIPVNPPPSIAPGASASFTIRFLSGSVGSKSAIVKLSTNDVSHKTFSFSLAGIGTAQVPAPAFAGGKMQCIPTGNTTVYIGCALPGASIYYTLDSSSPTVGNAGTKTYAGGISFTFTSTGMIRAMAVADGYVNSEVVTANFTKSITSAPTITSSGGDTYLSNKVSGPDIPKFTLRSDTTNVSSIVFTIDGTTTPDPETSGAVVVNDNDTVSDTTKTYTIVNGGTFSYAGPHAGGILKIQAVAFLIDSGEYYSSANQISTYNFQLAKPVWASTIPQDAYFTTAKSVTISCEGAAAGSIHYTTDGITAPTASSPVYASAIEVPLGPEGSSTDMLIQVIAIEAGWKDSEILSGRFFVCGPGKWDSSKWDQALWR